MLIIMLIKHLPLNGTSIFFVSGREKKGERERAKIVFLEALPRIFQHGWMYFDPAITVFFYPSKLVVQSLRSLSPLKAGLKNSYSLSPLH